MINSGAKMHILAKWGEGEISRSTIYEPFKQVRIMIHADCLPKVKFEIRDYKDLVAKIWDIAYRFGVDIPEHVEGDFFSATERAHDVYYNQLPYNVLGSYPLNA